jgi:predicted transposase YbfD/YdcC
MAGSCDDGSDDRIAAMDDAQGFAAGLRLSLSELSDPRVVGRCDHLLFDILAIAILATFCGADEWSEIEQFARAREAWLRTFLQLPSGIPTDDTFRRVFARLDCKQFAAGLFGWMQKIEQATRGRVVAVDGKTLRRSGRSGKGLRPLHLVTAFATENSLVLGQVACGEKSNEITAIPELLELLNIEKATVTIDALGCQKEIAAQIRQQKGHFVLGLKGNQPTLQADLQVLFDAAAERDFAGVNTFSTSEKDHGREEERIVHAIPIPQDHPQRELWTDLNTLVSVTSRRVQQKREHWETRFYISSHGAKAKPLAEAIRRHWSIENSQHHILDVAFGEDSRRQSDRHGATNLAAIRRLVLSVLRQEKTIKRGAKCKRLLCALNPDYLLKALEALPHQQTI